MAIDENSPFYRVIASCPEKGFELAEHTLSDRLMFVFHDTPDLGLASELERLGFDRTDDERLFTIEATAVSREAARRLAVDHSIPSPEAANTTRIRSNPNPTEQFDKLSDTQRAAIDWHMNRVLTAQQPLDKLDGKPIDLAVRSKRYGIAVIDPMQLRTDLRELFACEPNDLATIERLHKEHLKAAHGISVTNTDRSR